jgi:hypothetical protein
MAAAEDLEFFQLDVSSWSFKRRNYLEQPKDHEIRTQGIHSTTVSSV